MINTTCWRCKTPGATIADPCCGAPDCDTLSRYSHLECLPRALRALEEEDSGPYDRYAAMSAYDY